MKDVSLAVFLSLIAVSAAEAAPRICVFIGDSITLGTRTKPVAVTEQQRFSYFVSKRQKCKEVNVGASNDTTKQMLERFDVEFAQHKPSIIYIMTENDYWPGSQIPIEQSEKNLRAIIEKGKAVGAEVRIITPPPIGLWGKSCGAPIPRDSCKKLVVQIELEPSYIEMQRRVARETGAKLIDAHKANWSAKHFGDPWNLNPAGHKFITGVIN